MNQGPRSGQTPHPLGLRRGNWEFFAVIHGSMRPVHPDKAPGPFQSQRLWLMPPESPHAWFTPPGRTSRIYVFHFASIHPLLEGALPPSRTLSIPLNAADTRQLARLYTQLRPHYQSPRLSSAVHFDAAMLLLCTLFLERSREIASLSSFDTGGEKILQAVQWHREHFGEGVTVEDVAAALHISTGHLRRLFLKFRGDTPKHVFMHTTMEEACRLMAQSEMSIKEVAARCGFGGFSEFYRAFKNHTGQSPSKWRSNQFYRGLGMKTPYATKVS